MTEPRPIVVVVSASDPVASRVAEHWGTPPSIGSEVEGAPIRRLAPGVLLLKRPGFHIHDERLDARLPAAVVAERPTLVFPSIHESGQGIACLTVHPLGNLGPVADVGGRASTVAPTDPRRMAATLRSLSEHGERLGIPATLEATHHGPELGLPAYFVEIGFGPLPAPPPEAVRVLAETIPSAAEDPSDRIAVAVGGGHYAPHFTELTLRRRWAFGHIVSRHALEALDRPTAEAAIAATPGSDGLVFARAADQEHPALRGLAARLRDQDAPARDRSDRPVSRGGLPASGT